MRFFTSILILTFCFKNHIIFSQTSPVEEIVRFAGNFKGNLSSKIGIEMKIACQSGKITGKYFYNSQKINIKLEGTVNKDEVTIGEFTPKGVQTGVFKGKFQSKASDGVSLKGKWSTMDGKKSFPFEVTADFLKLTTSSGRKSGKYSFKVYTRTLIENTDAVPNPDDNSISTFSSLIVYQQIEGLANAAIQKKFNQELSPEKNTDKLDDILFPTVKTKAEYGGDVQYNLQIGFLYNNLITLSRGFYEFQTGAAHGMDGSESHTYNLDTGKECTMGELFSGNYLIKMNSWMKQKYQCLEQLEDEDQKKCIIITNETPFYLTDGAISFDFTGKCSFPYAARPCNEDQIPLEELKELINPASGLAGFVK